MHDPVASRVGDGRIVEGSVPIGRGYVDLVVTLDDDVELWCELKTTGSLGKYADGIDQIGRYVGAAGLRMGMPVAKARALARNPTPIPRKQGTPRVLIALISMIDIDLDNHRSWRTSMPVDNHGGFLWAEPRGHLIWSDFSAPARAALDGLEGFEAHLRDQYFEWWHQHPGMAPMPEPIGA